MNEQNPNTAITGPAGEQSASKSLDATSETTPSTSEPNEAQQPAPANNHQLTEATEKRPISEARLAANRANAQKSTAPVRRKANSAPA